MSYGNYPSLDNVNKVLVIKLRHLGDVLLATPVFNTLKRILPNSKIDTYIYKESYPMVAGHPCLDDVICYDRNWKKYPFLKRLKKEYEILKKIKNNKYDLVINLTEGDRGALAAKFSKAVIKVGFDPKESGVKGKRKFYTHLIKNCPTSRHSVEKNLDSLRRIGINPIEEDKEVKFIIPKEDEEYILNLLSANGFEKKDYILIHPSSRWRFKCYPKEKLLIVCKELLKRKEKLIFTAGNDDYEKEMISYLEENLSSSSVLNLAGKINLKKLGALLLHSKSMLCVDTVTLHMASSLKAKGVVLFGPTSEINWGPWKNNQISVIISPMFSCRPCGMDGCGGSKISDCLHSIQPKEIIIKL